ncbi:hypothetical protein OIO90_004595 [Microbotryomycetes sp. JL221]|nr:hypothetical protein OIO90_004595 [Microbotryomycetes sp. JL221]
MIQRAIKQYGTQQPPSGQYACPYGVLFEKTANELEALNGTLRSAKRQKKVKFDGEMLLHPRDKDVLVVLLDDPESS